MRIDKWRQKAPKDSDAPKRRRYSKVQHTALVLWRQDHPQEWAEAWEVAKLLVWKCYPLGSPVANHANALTVMRSALATEDPITWAAYTARAAAQVDAVAA